eukprot:12912975-Prorocentrum_lima.AAC.1
MKKVTNNKNSKSKNGMVMKKPTMLQRKNGMQGMKNGIGSKKTQEATVRKMQHVGQKTKTLINKRLNMWM